MQLDDVHAPLGLVLTEHYDPYTTLDLRKSPHGDHGVVGDDEIIGNVEFRGMVDRDTLHLFRDSLRDTLDLDAVMAV